MEDTTKTIVFSLIVFFVVFVIAVLSLTTNSNLGAVVTEDTLKQDSALNTEIDSFLGKIQKSQDDYFLKNKTYWQGLETHTTVPEYLTGSKGDKLTRVPGNVKETWIERIPIVDSVLPFSVRVDVFEEPNGTKGYTSYFFVKNNTGIFGKAYSTDLNKEFDWSRSN